MKKLLSVLIALSVMLIPLAVSANLGMSMSEFMAAYNKKPAPLGSPYKLLSTPDYTEPVAGYPTISFIADDNQSVVICLTTFDGNQVDSSSKIDAVTVIDFNNINIPCFLSVADRTLSVFLDEHLTLKQSSKCILEAMRDYYELNLSGDDQSDIELFLSAHLHFYTGDDYIAFIIKEDK